MVYIIDKLVITVNYDITFLNVITIENDDNDNLYDVIFDYLDKQTDKMFSLNGYNFIPFNLMIKNCNTMKQIENYVYYKNHILSFQNIILSNCSKIEFIDSIKNKSKIYVNYIGNNYFVDDMQLTKTKELRNKRSTSKLNILTKDELIQLVLNNINS